MKSQNLSKYLKAHNIEIDIDIPSLDGEIWIKINSEYYPLLKPVYWVSNKARIYNEKTKHILKTRCLDSEKNASPYYKVNLQIEIDGHSYGQVYSVHRLMMVSFYPCKGMNKLYVNHKDGDKLNDDLTNLEWTTSSENILHAIRNGLFVPVHGENHVCATITEDEAKQIIQLLLSRKYSYIDIAEIIGTTESIVGSIATKKSWKHLTKDIDFSCLKQRLPKKFTFDQLYTCCEYFQNNPKTDNISIRRYCMNALEYINYNNDITESVVNGVRALYKKDRYKQISDNFDF